MDPLLGLDQGQTVELHNSRCPDDNDGVFPDLVCLDVAHLGSLDDQIENWLCVPPLDPVGQEPLQNDNFQGTQVIHDDINSSNLAFGALHPSVLQPSSGPVIAVGPNSRTAGFVEDTAIESSVQTGKVGARFTRDTVKILRKWFMTYNRHPFPDEDNKKILQQQTGLSKTQITNWFANARRRNNMLQPKDDLPSSTQGRDIPPRPDTPAPRIATNYIDALERWVESPPEHEPASVFDIARAVASSPPTGMKQQFLGRLSALILTRDR
ncbi:hypothetical protein ACHAPJ_011822 [Fusarium lateritium]